MTPIAPDEADIRGPDFLCVGQQKAGTTWLYDQLQFHPEFWMPPVKELHYLSGKFPHSKMTAELERSTWPQNKQRKWHANRERDRNRKLDERDTAFFEVARAAVGQAFGLDRYAAFFAPKQTLLSGDISPSYAGLPAERISAIAQRWPRLRIILFVRDPVERAWSNINKGIRGQYFDTAKLDDPAAVTRYLSAPGFSASAFPTQVADRWRHSFGDRLHVDLFDTIASDPQRAIDAVLDSLGASDKPTTESDFNRKAEHKKVAMPDPVRKVLIEHFAEELHAAGSKFGGVASTWAARYGL